MSTGGRRFVTLSRKGHNTTLHFVVFFNEISQRCILSGHRNKTLCKSGNCIGDLIGIFKKISYCVIYAQPLLQLPSCHALWCMRMPENHASRNNRKSQVYLYVLTLTVLVMTIDALGHFETW